MARLYLYGARMCIPNYDACPIKIGITCHPQQRFKSIAGSLPFPVTWFGAWPAQRGRASEAQVFEMFAAYRLNGEWFFPNEGLIEYVQTQVKNYKELVESWDARIKARDPKRPDDVNEWSRTAAVWSHEEFNESFEAHARVASGLCPKCAAPATPERISTDAAERRKRCEAAIATSRKPVYSIETAAALLEMKPETLQSYVRKQAIPTFRWSARSQDLLRPNDIRAFMNSGWWDAQYDAAIAPSTQERR